jgi:hypothetical protein
VIVITLFPEWKRDNTFSRIETGNLRHLKKLSCVFDELSKDGSMATSTSSNFFPGFASAVPSGKIHAARRRRIDPLAGHALETLGHAIEYLADELVHEGGNLSTHRGQIDAIQLLMACNRDVFFDCPEVPSFGERWRSWVHRHQ